MKDIVICAVTVFIGAALADAGRIFLAPIVGWGAMWTLWFPLMVAFCLYLNRICDDYETAKGEAP